MSKTTILGFFLSVLILCTSFQNDRNETEQTESENLIPDLIKGLKSTLTDSTRQVPVYLDGEQIALCPQIRQFYVLHNFRPVWTNRNHLNESGAKLFSLLEHAREYGLEPENYHFNSLRNIQGNLKAGKNRSDRGHLREAAEIMLTDAAMKFMVNLHWGYGTTGMPDSSAWIENLPAILIAGIGKEKLIESILSVQPRFIEYIHLQQATGRFVDHTELTDAWQEITDPKKDTLLFVSQVKQVLLKLGYVNNKCSEPEIIAGLKEFQLHHGFEPDGKAGVNTLEALRMSSLYHYRMLALNLDRLRKQENSEDNLLYVNIPAYQLKIFKENRLQGMYRVIVGNPKTPTPQLTSKVERIIANPVWDVPQSITRNELIPKIKADSGYLKRNRFKLIDRQNHAVNPEDVDLDMISGDESGYKFRQDASTDNALGQVKFIFANPYAVYLHDTPGKALFSKDIRDLSHGCIRVQNPEKLAEYMVRTIQSDNTDIAGLIAKGIHREINLTMAVPIRLGYITCATDENGGLFFYKDIYGIDQKELAELAPFMGI